jgi:hypothetical protein
MTEREQLKREECRLDTRLYLYEIGMGAAQRPGTINDGMRRKGQHYETEEVRLACLFWTAEGQFEELPSQAGPTKYYRISAEGMKEHIKSIV